MGIVLILFLFGSLFLSFHLSLQVKLASPELMSIVKYNLVMFPVIMAANITLGLGFAKGHSLLKNLSSLVAAQAFVYYIFIVLFSAFLLKDDISYPKTILGFALIVLGIFNIRS